MEARRNTPSKDQVHYRDVADKSNNSGQTPNWDFVYLA